MKKNKAILLSAVIILFVFILIRFLFVKPDVTKALDGLRKESGLELDSFNNRLATEKKHLDSIQFLISSGNLQGANNIIDETLKKDPASQKFHLLKGQVYDAGKQYDSALTEYDFVIRTNPYPLAYDRRATTMVKLGKYVEAITDYRKAFELNYDYSYKLGQVFELVKQKDSALKYYKIYLKHYPDSNLQRKITSLQK